MNTATENSELFIIRTLKRMVEHRTPITLNFKGVRQQFISMLLSIDVKQKTITLDEFSPAEGNKLASPGTKFRVAASNHGVNIAFYTTILSSGLENNILYYTVPIPTEMAYHQRRDTFRVKLSSNATLSLKLPETIENCKIETPTPHDISNTGIGFTLAGNITTHLKQFMIITSCQLLDSGQILATVKLEIRFIKYNELENKTFIGARFVQLDKIDFNKINKQVAALQRELLRRESRIE